MKRAPPSPAKPATGIKQTIQARHGVATYVPQGYTIKIINTYGKQVVDTWAFALHAPPEDSEIDKGNEKNDQEPTDSTLVGEGGVGEVKREGEQQAQPTEANSEDVKAEKESDVNDERAGKEEEEEEEEDVEASDVTDQNELLQSKAQNENEDAEKLQEGQDDIDQNGDRPKGGKGTQGEEADEGTSEKTRDVSEKVHQDTQAGGEQVEEKVEDATPKKSRWSAYIPNLQRSKAQSKTQVTGAEDAAEDKMSKSWSSYLGMGGGQKDGSSSNTNSQKKGWSAYIPSGQGFSSYIPSKDGLSLSTLTGDRDPTKSYAEQLLDFSKTPVGAAGLSAATGSGYAGSIYAAYKAYEQTAGNRDVPAMEYMSMMHTRASTLHLCPRIGDTLVSNLRAPLFTVVEDTSPGTHDTLIAACDPQRYKELGVEKWEEHGSCSENCVLALKEINERSGLKGKRAIGSDVTVNTVPAPLNLFMNIPWTKEGDVSFEAPTTKRGDYIKLRAERDVVVVMSACPQDVLSINGGKPMVAHFVVESSSPDDLAEAKRKAEEAEAILSKARSRMSSGGQSPGTTKKEDAKREAANQAPKNPSLDHPNVKSPTNNPRPGKKPPRKLEKRGSTSAARSASTSAKA